MRAALKTAISNGRPFTTDDWEKEMNIKKPPELLKAKIISLPKMLTHSYKMVSAPLRMVKTGLMPSAAPVA
jgi:hypothetical protein